ncbi:pyridoxal-phosphate-dependent aminotransferase family protein [Nitrospina gracilis]|uniref:pyridoxal-phosphate-dependent aminotransferase family protein n=1 Tax=Nitrospina gracilis TaxID=35801 RepID=UPI001F265CB1|nr:alanine--glyoxylate aminotransferase family protein [Nitrospina gracilis]MCF8721362.1 aspartate aminotransferase-like enzyme [Nitrospina gracilis Nb-211]
MNKTYLLAPGPTPVPEKVNLEMAAPMIHHRTPQFSKIFGEAAEDAKYLFQTKQDVMILASTGTGGMEACITNLFSPGDKVLVINGGKFGERWGKISETYGLEPIWINVEWGQAVNVADVKAALEKNPDIRGVLVQASETSTTVSHPIEEISKLTRQREDLLLVVDGITAVGVYPLPMDEWGIDAVITGSQKALQLPPGLALVALSEKAWKRAETAKCPHFYFDLRKERKNLADKTTAYTPAVSLVIGLREVLKNIKEEGLENVHKRHNRLARATRAAVNALGMKPVAPDSPADSATGMFVPEGVDGGKLVKSLRDEFGVTMAGGQDQWKGKVVRIAHLGYVDTFDTVVAIAALEMALKKFGANIQMGKGVAAAQEILLEAYCK